MSARMSRYYKDETLEESRTNRNKDKYQKLKEDDFKDLNLTSNISVIDADIENLSIDELKKLLDEKYIQNKRRKEQLEEIEETDEKLEDTKEYDLTKIIAAAHKNKDDDYDKERFKKLRETQYDILSSLNLPKSENDSNEKDDDDLTDEESKLMNLIKKIDENETRRLELKQEEDLLDSLKAEDESDVLEPVSFDNDEVITNTDIINGKKPTLLEELEKTKQLSRKDIDEAYQKEIEETPSIDDIEEESNEESKVREQNTVSENTMENSFYTGKLQIKDSDMDDFEDLQKHVTSGNIVIKILILVIVIIILGVIVFLLNKFLELGLF